MRGMSFALVPVKTSDPQAIARELDTIFDTRKGLSKGKIRFVPNKRLKAVLIIHVYNVQNRTASELAKVLQSVYRTEDGGRVAVEGTVAPKLEPVAVIAPQLEGGGTGAGPEAAPQPEPAEEAAPATEASGEKTQDAVRIVADDANNSLLIVSTDAEFERMLRVLQDIDMMPNQVLLEARMTNT
jgi:general secretion pathway protein D